MNEEDNLENTARKEELENRIMINQASGSNKMKLIGTKVNIAATKRFSSQWSANTQSRSINNLIGNLAGASSAVSNVSGANNNKMQVGAKDLTRPIIENDESKFFENVEVEHHNMTT